MFVYNSVLGQLIPIDFYISGEASFPVPLLFLMQIMYSLFIALISTKSITYPYNYEAKFNVILKCVSTFIQSLFKKFNVNMALSKPTRLLKVKAV